MAPVSKDGYLRMTVSAFENIPLVHLLSGLDENNTDTDQLRTDVCGISGYTEWISSTTPTISIGWDWRLDVTQGRPRYVLEGFPRSNLMFQDAERRDLGPTRTATVLKVALDTISWQEETMKAISDRYAQTS